MLGSATTLHAQSLVSLVRHGVPDSSLVSSQCGGRVDTYSLLLAIHSPLLAELLVQVGDGVVGITLPLPLVTLRGLVALLQGEDEKVTKEMKEAADALGIVRQKEGEEIPIDRPNWEDGPEPNVRFKESKEYTYKSLNISEERILKKEEGKADSKEYAPLSNEDTRQTEKNQKYFRRKYTEFKEEDINGSQPSRAQVCCNKCSKKFTNKYYIKKHTTAVHEKQEMSATCSNCSKQVSIISISSHEKICRMSAKEKEEYNKRYDKQLQCFDCEKTFMNLSKLNRHKESIHSRDKNYRCQYCGIQEQGRADLKLHIKQNHEDGKYKPKLKRERTLCNVCCRSFNDKQYLEKHMLFTH